MAFYEDSKKKLPAPRTLKTLLATSNGGYWNNPNEAEAARRRREALKEFGIKVTPESLAEIEKRLETYH